MVEFEDTTFLFDQSWPILAFDLKGFYCKELFTAVEWENRLAKAGLEATSVGS